MKTPLSSLFGLFLASTAAFAADPAILVERVHDQRGRNRIETQLSAVRVDFNVTDMTAKEFAEWIAVVGGSGVNCIVVAPSPDDLPRVTMNLTQVRVTQLMRLVADVTDLAFVYRNGVIMIKPKEDVREETSLRIYDVRAAVAPLTDFPAPVLIGLRPSGYESEEPERESSQRTLSGFDTEQLADLVRNNVRLGNWDDEGVSLTVGHGLLLVRQTERGHREVAKVLAALGVYAGPIR